MGQTYRGVGRVDTLSTVSGCTHYVEYGQSFIIDLTHLHPRASGITATRDRGGVDTSAGLRLRHTLYAVHTALIFQHGICALTVDHKAHTPSYRRCRSHRRLIDLDLPALALCIMHIHTVNLRCEKCRLVSARTGTDLHDNVLIIIRVFWKKQNL